MNAHCFCNPFVSEGSLTKSVCLQSQYYRHQNINQENFLEKAITRLYNHAPKPIWRQMYRKWRKIGSKLGEVLHIMLGSNNGLWAIRAQYEHYRHLKRNWHIIIPPLLPGWPGHHGTVISLDFCWLGPFISTMTTTVVVTVLLQADVGAICDLNVSVTN